MIYASATNGYKSGGYSNTARAVVGAGFGPEFIWSYEAGVKSDWFARRLRFDISVFHYVWTGLQFASTVAPDITATSNAGAATLNGLEADIIAKPMSGLTLTANTTLLASKYVSFNAYAVPSIIKQFLLADPNYNPAAGTYDASGKQLVNAPPVSINLSAQKDFDLADGADLFIRAQYQFDARTFFDPTNVVIASRPAYGLINASIGYSPPGSHWQVALWGKNLADAQYINGANLGGTLTGPVGDPRTFGIRINYDY
jgi:iron complex outermembrane receptor protein